MMKPGLAEHVHDERQDRVRSGAHVQRPDGQPGGFDSDHRNSSRNQPAHSIAAEVGRAMLTAHLQR